jgi:hypothetical protein
MTTELNDAVRSIQEQSVTPRKLVLVVDDDNLASQLRTAFSATTVVSTRDGGLDAGVLETSSEFVALLDSSAFAPSSWLEELLRCQAEPRVLCVNGPVEARWATRKPRWFPADFNWVVGCTRSASGPSRGPIGTNMLIRRSVFDAVGGFRAEAEPLPELDFCVRAGQVFPAEHWICWPPAAVTRFVSANEASWSYFRSRCFREGVAEAVMPKPSVQRVVAPRLDGQYADRGMIRTIAAIIGVLHIRAGYMLASRRLPFALTRTLSNGATRPAERRGQS